MARRGDTYSRVIAWLKVVFPLIALVLLSTMFMLTRDLDPGADIPVTQGDLRDRAEQQQITAPFYTGTTEAGAQVSLSAMSARPNPEEDNKIIAFEVSARIVTPEKTVIEIEAAEVELDQLNGAFTLRGGVTVISSNGYRATTESLTGKLDPLEAHSQTPVEGEGPAGRFRAGGMSLVSDAETGDLQFNFTGGVNLLYDPKSDPE